MYWLSNPEEELQRIDVEEEYLNQYTIGSDSIFGKVMPEDEEIMEEWM